MAKVISKQLGDAPVVQDGVLALPTEPSIFFFFPKISISFTYFFFLKKIVVLDLAAEVVLPEEITGKDKTVHWTENPSAVLLTGATGIVIILFYFFYLFNLQHPKKKLRIFGSIFG